MTAKFPKGLLTDISCPNCGPAVKLVVRENGMTGHQFLGCANYPNCDYKRGIPEEWKMRAAGQAGLFDAPKAQP